MPTRLLPKRCLVGFGVSPSLSVLRAQASWREPKAFGANDEPVFTEELGAGGHGDTHKNCWKGVGDVCACDKKMPFQFVPNRRSL